MAREKVTATISRDERGDWTIEAGRFQATLPATGPEVDAWVDAGKPTTVEDSQAPERVVKLAASVSKTYATRPLKPGVPGRTNGLPKFAPVDGEEVIEVRPHSRGRGLSDGWLAVCDSPRCHKPRNTFPYRKPVYEGPSKDAAEQAATKHRVWHSERYPISARMVLDHWILGNAMVSAPEPDRAELDRQLAIARAER